MDRREALPHVYFLKTLSDSVLAEIAAAGSERRYQKGEILFLEKSRCLGLIVVLSGAVKVYQLDSRGRELTLDLEMPGESVAEVSLFDGGNNPARAEAAEDATTVLIVPPYRFHQVMAAHPAIAELGLKALGIRMRKLMQMVEAQALRTVQARLADYLLRLSEDRSCFSLTDTNDVVGSRIGTVREVISRTLRILVDAGAITLNGRQVTIRDAQVLRRIAGHLDGAQD